jgi:hypothetical protein
LGEDGQTAVAVRSSATAEDLAGASFAGQQETYLNVRGADALLEAVKNCWASLWTARAMAYRTRQGIDPATVSLAVVVQRMVESEAAGVMFTANPSNGRRNELTISAAWGLGRSRRLDRMRGPGKGQVAHVLHGGERRRRRRRPARGPVGSLYSGKLVEGPDGRPYFLAWRNIAPDGTFVGELADPFQVAVDGEGNLTVGRAQAHHLR